MDAKIRAWTSNFSGTASYNPFNMCSEPMLLIEEAVLLGNFDLVQALLTAGANPNFLHLAKTREMAILLLNNGADVNLRDWDGKTPIFHAIERGCTDVVEFLLQNDASLYVTSGLGENIHHCVIRHYDGNLEIFKLLSQHIIHVNPVNFYSPAVHLAFKLRKFDLLEEMVKEGASLNVRDHCGLTVLHVALLEPTFDLTAVTNLLKLGADPNMECCEFNSKEYPIEMAIRNGNVSILSELLKYGASVKPENAYNPLITALECSHTNSDQIVQLLLNYGAKAGSYYQEFVPLLNLKSPVIHALCQHSHELTNTLKLLVKYSTLQYFSDIERKTEKEIKNLLNNAYNYGMDCLRECDQMQRIFLHKNHTLYSYLMDFHINNLCTRIESCVAVLNFLFSKECTIYRDLIIKLLNRNVLIPAIMKNKSVSDFKRLNNDSIYYLTNYLSHNDLCNMLLALI